MSSQPYRHLSHLPSRDAGGARRLKPEAGIDGPRATARMARTITDQEIALIKAMIARGIKNTDIQFFFNRPGRPVNSGRISNIADGSYSDSALIPAATDDELNTFLAERSPSTDVPGVVIASTGSEADPVSRSVSGGDVRKG